MSVHYKFKSSLEFDTITFDGLHISVNDLKKAVLTQKRLGKITDFDLQIINAQTKEEYGDDCFLIPKNTSLIVSRVPLTNQNKKSWILPSGNTLGIQCLFKTDNTGVDIAQMEGSEEDKIQAVIQQSSAEYDPRSFQKIKSNFQSGEVPAFYRCNRCRKGGHWIKNCPLSVMKDNGDTKRLSGIPKSFLEKEESHRADTEDITLKKKVQIIPEDLLCKICSNIFTDAVMIPCCGSTFCDDCVRIALLESDDNQCPECNEKGSSPGFLIPNRFLRNSVNIFKNESGCNLLKEAKNEQVQNILAPGKKSNDVEPTAITKNDVFLNIEADNEFKSNINMQSNMKNIINKDENKLAKKSKSEEFESDIEDNIIIKMPSVQENAEMYHHQRYYQPKLSSLMVSHVENTPEEYIQKLQTTHSATAQVMASNSLQQLSNQKDTPGMSRHYYMRHLDCNDRSLGMSGRVNSQRKSATNLSSIYRGVAEKLGPGIIDDPLEVFNRIMKEKEMRKQHQRRSCEKHRSRTFEKGTRNRINVSPFRITNKGYEKRLKRDVSPYIAERRENCDAQRSSSQRHSVYSSEKNARSPCYSSKDKQSLSKKFTNLQLTKKGLKQVSEPPPPGFEIQSEIQDVQLQSLQGKSRNLLYSDLDFMKRVNGEVEKFPLRNNIRYDQKSKTKNIYKEFDTKTILLTKGNGKTEKLQCLQREKIIDDEVVSLPVVQKKNEDTNYLRNEINEKSLEYESKKIKSKDEKNVNDHKKKHKYKNERKRAKKNKKDKRDREKKKSNAHSKKKGSVSRLTIETEKFKYFESAQNNAGKLADYDTVSNEGQACYNKIAGSVVNEQSEILRDEVFKSKTSICQKKPLISFESSTKRSRSNANLTDGSYLQSIPMKYDPKSASSKVEKSIQVSSKSRTDLCETLQETVVEPIENTHTNTNCPVLLNKDQISEPFTLEYLNLKGTDIYKSRESAHSRKRRNSIKLQISSTPDNFVCKHGDSGRNKRMLNNRFKSVSEMHWKSLSEGERAKKKSNTDGDVQLGKLTDIHLCEKYPNSKKARVFIEAADVFSTSTESLFNLKKKHSKLKKRNKTKKKKK